MQIINFNVSFLKKLLPPILTDVLYPQRMPDTSNSIVWRGNYSDWEDALKYSCGYDDKIILDRVKSALLKVKNGEAIYERDSVLFDKIEYSWPLLACLQNIAIAGNNQLHLVDFGGSLGSTYFQNVHFLDKVSSLKWFIVEQSHFVDVGKNEFENSQLKFAYTIDEVLREAEINCLLLSGVLQCLGNPYEWISKFLEKNFSYIIIDRTAFIKDNQRLTVETVPESIYPASYPSWFFNEEQFLDTFSHKYDLIADFRSYADSDILSEDQKLMYWKGFFFKLKM